MPKSTRRLLLAALTAFVLVATAAITVQRISP